MRTYFIFILPLIFSGIFHMILVKANWAAWANRPVSETVFGPNKTWRGLLFIPLLTIMAVYITYLIDSQFSPPIFDWKGRGLVWWGVALGLGYTLAEFPNSFLKRRLGITAGQLPSGPERWFFLILDQADSAIGCAFVYRWGANLNWDFLLALILIGTGFHLFFNVLLFYLGLRKNKF